MNCEPTLRSESRGQTCLHYAEPRGGKDPEGGLPDERSNGERLLADYPLQGGGKDPEGGLIVNCELFCRAARRKRDFFTKNPLNCELSTIFARKDMNICVCQS